MQKIKLVYQNTNFLFSPLTKQQIWINFIKSVTKPTLLYILLITNLLVSAKFKLCTFDVITTRVVVIFVSVLLYFSVCVVKPITKDEC